MEIAVITIRSLNYKSECLWLSRPGKGLQLVLEKTNCTNIVKLNSNVVVKCPTIHISCLVSLDSFYIVVLEF